MSAHLDPEYSDASQERILTLEKEIAYLRRQIDKLHMYRVRQENLADNNRALLRRINEENAGLLRQVEEKNAALEQFAHKLKQSLKEKETHWCPNVRILSSSNHF